MSARKHTRPSCFIEILESRKLLSLTADFNADAHVNSLDFTVLAVNFNGTNKTHAQGDANLDTRVNAQDFNALAGEFGRVEPMPLTENDFAGGSADNDADYSLGHVPTSTEKAVFPASAAGFDTGFSAPHTFGELVSDEAGGGYDFSPSQISVLGNATINNSPGNTLAASGGDVLGTGNSGALTIGLLTGSGKTINTDFTGINVALASTADYTVGSTCKNSGVFEVMAGTQSGAKLRFDHSSMAGTPDVVFENQTISMELVSDATAGATNVSLNNSTIPAGFTLTSIMDGKFRDYHQHQSWTVGGSKTPGGTVTVTVPSNYTGSGFTPTLAALSGYGGDPVAGSLAGSTFSFVVPADMPLGNTGLLLQNGDDSIEITLDTITVTAAATGGVPSNRISTATGLGL